jgi:hypothetical protein
MSTKSLVIHSPEWKQVSDMVDCMDGEEYTELVVKGAGDRNMTIGGGGDRFIATILGPDFGPMDLKAGTACDDIVKIRIGGADTYMPSIFVSEKNRLLQALKFFYSSGEADPSLEWEAA